MLVTMKKQNSNVTRDDILSVRADTAAIRFADYLLVQAKQFEGKRSGKKTKLLLLASAAKLFDTVPPQDMRVSDICQGANASQGTYYLHFETKTDIVIELLSRFVDFEIGTMPVFARESHPFENILKMVYWYEDSFRLNFGIMLYLVRLSDVHAELAEIWRRRAEFIVDRLLQWVGPHYGLDKEEDGHVRQMCFSVGSMMDESLFARYGVHGAVQSSQHDDFELVTELQAILIYRSIFAGNPPAEMLTVGKVFLPLIQVDSNTGERL